MADDEQDDPAEPWQPWLARITAARKRRDDLIPEWQDNVERRRARPTESVTPSSTTVSVPKDWALTKAKIAQLYSQTPEVRLAARDPQFEPAMQPFARELNDTLTECNVGATIEELLSDVINASGISAVIITCDKRTMQAQIPKVSPMIAGMSGQPVEMMPVTRVADIQYLVDRISPSDLLIPSDFTGSDYNKARWLGREGRMPWAQAVNALHVTDEEKDEVLSTDRRAKGATATLSSDTNKFKDTQVVNYTEIFYWRHYYHPEETNFKALQHLVFVEGLDEPKINEPYQVQARMEGGRVVGVLRNPIQVLTLTYISDDSLPPSDSSVARYQVQELQQLRQAMQEQRKHSIPIRWGDTNRISPNTRAKIDEGTHQGWIWTNGPGERAIGEVARASFPSERGDFDAIYNNELTEIFQVGTNQAGAFAKGERSAREAGIIEQNFQRRVGIEQDKVQKHFLAIAEVLAGHLAIYGTFTLPDQLGPMRQELANAFTYSLRVDSTVRLDAEEQIERLTKGLNLTAQSGYVNPKPVIAKIWSLLGENPEQIVIDPQPKAPEPVKVSVGSAEDIINPVMLGALMRTGQAPSPEDLAAAVKLLQDALAGGVPLVPPSPTPDGPQGDIEHPKGKLLEWEATPRIDRRADDGGAPA